LSSTNVALISFLEQDDDWDSLPAMTSNAPPVPAATFGDDEFGGGGFGATAEAPATEAPAAGFDGFGEEPAAPQHQDSVFGGGFGDETFGAAPPVVSAAAPIDFSGAGDFGGDLAPAPVPVPVKEVAPKKSMFSNAPVVDNCETTALE
jgi:hypothetical protein